MPAPESAKRPNETFLFVDSLTDSQRAVMHAEKARVHARRAFWCFVLAACCAFVAFSMALVQSLEVLR